MSVKSPYFISETSSELRLRRIVHITSQILQNAPETFLNKTKINWLIIKKPLHKTSIWKRKTQNTYAKIAFLQQYNIHVNSDDGCPHLAPFDILLASLFCVASNDVWLNVSNICLRTFSVRSGTSAAVKPRVGILGRHVIMNLPVKTKNVWQAFNTLHHDLF